MRITTDANAWLHAASCSKHRLISQRLFFRSTVPGFLAEVNVRASNSDCFDSCVTDHKAREQINDNKMTLRASESSFATDLIFTASRRPKVWSCPWTWRLEDSRPTHLITEAEVNAMTSHGSSFFLVPFVLGLEHYEELLLKHTHTHSNLHTFCSGKLSSNMEDMVNVVSGVSEGISGCRVHRADTAQANYFWRNRWLSCRVS